MNTELVKSIKKNPNKILDFARVKVVDAMKTKARICMKQAKPLFGDKTDCIQFEERCVERITNISQDFSLLKEDFEQLEQMENLYADATEPAWRPKTGTVSMEPINSYYLMYRKRKLDQLVARQYEDIQKLMDEIRMEREIIQQQRKAIKEASISLMKL